MIQRFLAIFTRDFSEVFSGTVESHYLVGPQGFFTALAPTDLLPGRRRQAEGQLLYRDGRMTRLALQALGGPTATWLARGYGQGLLPWFPDGGVRLNAHDILQSELREIRTKLCALPITRVRQHHSHRNLLLHRLPNLLQSNLWLGLKPNLFRDARWFTACRILAPHFRQV